MKEMQTDSFITNNIRHDRQLLDDGLPYSIRSKDSSLRILKGYPVVKKSVSIMSVPAEYQQFGF